MSAQGTADDGDVVSITEAAQRLGVSVRTVQRRLDAGQLEAVIEGDTRRVRLGDKGDGVSRDNDATGRQVARHGATSNATEGNIPHDSAMPCDAPKGDAQRDTSRDNATAAPGTLAALLAEKDARIVDLRSQIDAQRLQIEAANRTAAEAQAALREALKLSHRALPEGRSQSTADADNNSRQSREDRSERSESTAEPKEPPLVAEWPQIEPQRQSEGRKTFRRWLLELLRG